MTNRKRVFGIGHQRTGTTSLSAACRRLGWNCKHGDYLRLPGSYDLNDSVYEKFDMLCDTPYFQLFDKLDRRFPDSKFILTIRPVESWLESVRWLYEFNQNWKTRPVVGQHQILLYGTDRFDEPMMREAYETHNRRVREHFADRPTQLLVFDITAGAGWTQLCEFLGCEVPDEEFPHRNKSD